MMISKFKSNYLNPEKVKVEEVIRLGLESKIVLPEFQREFVWGADDIKELLSSIMGGYFIGTLLIHENTKEKINFALRPLPFVNKTEKEIPEGSILKIILDGQQRISSIIYALTSPNIPLKGKKNPHKFFLNLETLFNNNILESIEAISMNKTNRKKYLSKEYLYVKENFPEKINEVKYVDLSILFSKGQDGIDELFDDLREVFGKEKAQLVRKLLRNILEYEIIYIKIPQETTIDEIVEIFERINKTSYKLSTVDLLFAKLYKEMGTEIRKLILKKLEDIKSDFPEYKDIIDIVTIVRIILLLSNKELKPSSMITLTSNDFNTWLDFSIDGLKEGLHWLKEEAGVRKGLIPYTPLIVPLASIFASLKYENQRNQNINKYSSAHIERETREFIKVWYWTSVLSERYDEGATSKIVADFKLYKSFLQKLTSKETANSRDVLKKFPIIDINKFKEIKSKNSALLKAFQNLLILNKVTDFETRKTWDYEFTDDHIFPKSLVGDKADIVLNRTLLTPDTNKYLKNKKNPSLYFQTLKEKYGKKDLLFQILQTHFIDEKAFQALLKDDFSTFIEERLKNVKTFLIEKLKLKEYLK
jgi:hypothetical protein